MLKKRFWHRAYLAGLALFALLLALSLGGVLLKARGELLQALGEGEAFRQAWQGLVERGLALGLAAFFMLAAALYLLLLGLSKPLEDMVFTEQRFAAGNYGIRAGYKGRDEIGRLSRSFNHMAESVESTLKSLEENAELKQQLVDNLSHELRTPLTAIDGYADYVWQAALSEEEIYRQMEKIKGETRRLLRISNRMLEISALRDASRRQNKTPVNPVPLSRLFGQVQTTLGPAAEKQGVALRVCPPPGERIIHGDPAMLESLCVNLVHNAMKACEAGQQVEIRAADSPEGGLVLEVEDTGCGMTAEQLSHLGEEFYRADKARSRAHGGAGLGVALCFQIAQAHGAVLSYRSKPGVGTLATVVFPQELVRGEE